MEQKKFVCLGDSLTEGYPFFGKSSWVSLLNETNIAHFVNKGICGQLSTDIAKRFPSDVLDIGPDYVFLMFGSNDFLFTSATPEDVLEQYANLALASMEKGIIPVVLIPMVTIPEMASQAWDSEIFYNQVNQNLTKLRELLLGFTDAAHILCVDLQLPYTQLCSADSESIYYSDGLHPSKLGYEAIAQILKKFCETLFST